MKALFTRIAEMELKLGLAEDHIDELNKTIFRQQQQLDLLQAQLRELHRQMHTSAEEFSSNPGQSRDEFPPHY